MHDHSILGSCGAFLRAVASHWSGGGHWQLTLSPRSCGAAGGNS